MASYSDYASEILYICKKAGEIIMGYYNDNITPINKPDNSPLTQADIAAHNYIKGKLSGLTPQIPVVSEENSEEENSKAIGGGIFWLVDPLDGTKSFIKQTGEFTVNIALIRHGVPDGGAVYIPFTQTGYFTAEDGKAYKQSGNDLPNVINARKMPAKGAVSVVASKSHRTEATDEYIKSLGREVNIVPAASSLKFCMVAEGSADIYPRFGNTMEWDTAAGHAVLNAAGGSVTCPDGSALIYDKGHFLNPFFIAKGAGN